MTDLPPGAGDNTTLAVHFELILQTRQTDAFEIKTERHHPRRRFEAMQDLRRNLAADGGVLGRAVVTASPRADNEARARPRLVRSRDSPQQTRYSCRVSPAPPDRRSDLRAEREPNASKPALSLSNGGRLGIRCRIHRIDKMYPHG